MKMLPAGLLLLFLASPSLAKRDMHHNNDHNGAVWSAWSNWSACSRSCDGGISSRDRHCFSPQLGRRPSSRKRLNNATREEEAPPCPGVSRRDRICNIQPCPPSPIRQDFRSQQCAEFNDVPYQGKYYLWEASEDPNQPCQLVCKAIGHQDVVVGMDRPVKDGTRCRKDSLDMCVQGKCRSVGCDLHLDSRAQLDRCGRCVGPGQAAPSANDCPDGSSQLSFVWTEVPLSQCSVPCGGGHMMAHSVCINNHTRAKVHEDMCDVSTRPAARMAPCNNRPCPARWEVDDWGPCSKSCGGGVKARNVACIIDKDGKKMKVSGTKCPNLRPPARESCQIEKCPQWYTGIWSECDVKCGRKGLQHRNVICRDARGYPSGSCGLVDKPAASQPCTGTGAGKPDCRAAEGGLRLRKGTQDDAKADYTVNGWKKLNSDMGETGTPPAELEHMNAQQELPGNQSLTLAAAAPPLPPQKLVNEAVPTEASFIVEDWGPCSAACGEGIRKRRVECKIFLEFSKTVATLPDNKCPGPKPLETEICFAGLCDVISLHQQKQLQQQQEQQPTETAEEAPEAEAEEDVIKTEDGRTLRRDIQGDDTAAADLMASNRPLNVLSPKKKVGVYKWKEDGFSQCSESCLGGIQESRILCVDSELNTPVSPVNCRVSERPEVKVQTCNDHPCPPRWNVTEFSTCSKSCGGGLQTRQVSCIQELRHGASNILAVDDRFCPQPPPITQQFCNVVDCPIAWNVTPWTKCSKLCGGGQKYRKVRCQQLLALGELANKPDNQCPRPRPESDRICNAQACSEDYIERPPFDRSPPAFSQIIRNGPDLGAGDQQNANLVVGPSIKANLGQVYEQMDPEERTVKLKVGGRATLFEGTKVKIRCPVKKFDKKKLRWTKGNALVRSGEELQYERKKKKNRTFGDPNATSAFVTKKGSLRIRKIGYEDAGVYTCKAKHSTASIEIIVKDRIHPNDVLFGTTEHRQSNKKGQQRQNLGLDDDDDDDDDSQSNVYGVIKHKTDKPYSFDEYSYGRLPLPTPPSSSHREEHDRWAIFTRVTPTPEQSWNNNHRLYVTVPTRKDNDPLDHATVSTHSPADVADMEHSPYNEVGHSYWDDFTDFDPEEEEESRLVETDQDQGPGHDETTSRARSNKSWSGALIIASFLLVQLVTQATTISPIHFKEDPVERFDEEEEGEDDEILDERDEPELKMQWKLTDWSRCSQTCGRGGKQYRDVSCIVTTANSTEVEEIPTALCEDSGLERPESVRECGEGLQACPRWVVKTKWSKCQRSGCVEKNKALQVREVVCATSKKNPDSTQLDDNYCEAILKPRMERKCHNKRCKPIWKTGPWRQCSSSCGEGRQQRGLYCTWKKHHGIDFEIRRPGRLEIHHSTCADSPKPSVSRVCQTLPACVVEEQTTMAQTTEAAAAEDEEVVVLVQAKKSLPAPSRANSSCKEESKYCHLVKSFNMCQIEKYQVRCCISCAGDA